MALTKVTGDFIKAGSITQGHLHSSHGITTSHITEGDKLFFTNARVDSRIGSLSSSDLSEGTNLYYTDARARAAISATGSLSYNSTTGVMSFTMPAQNTSNITEGSNLYYTNARADARIAAADTGDLSEGANLYYTQARFNTAFTAKSTSDLSEGTNLYYTDARADARVALIVDSAPGALNTLNELAAALGDDANFSTTITNSIATKLPLAGGTLTGNLTVGGTSGSTGNALAVNRGSDNAQAMRIQNSGEVVIPSNYLYCNAAGTSLYVQNTAVFRGSITNDGGDVTIDDNLNVTGTITCNNAASDKKIAFRRTGGKSISIEHDTSQIYFYNETDSSVLFTIANNANLTTTGSISVSGGNSGQWNTAYAYSQVGHLPLSGGTLSGFIQLGANQLRFDQSGTRSWTVSAAGGNLNINSGDSVGNVAISSGLTVADNATFSGDIVAPGIYVGSANTSYDFYNNGTSYFNGTSTFDDNILIPSASHDLHIGNNLSTTGKVRFGLSSWNNSIGLESYWMVMRSNSNEGYKFIDSGGNTYAQFNASTNSSGAYNTILTGNLYANALYDQNNTAYYINPESGAVLKGVQCYTNGSNAVGNQLKVYSTTNHQYPQVHSNGAIEAMWNYKNTAVEWYVGIRTSSQLVGTAGFHFYNTSLSQTVGGWDVNGHSYSIGSSRAPIFYDSNDTNYYFDGNGTSVLSKIWCKGSSANSAPRWDTSFHVVQSQHFYGHNNSQTLYFGESNPAIFGSTLTVAGVIDANGGHGGINITNTSILSDRVSTWTGNPGTNGKMQYHSARWYIVSDSSSDMIVQFRRNGSDVSYIDNAGRLMNAPDLRVPIYYDTDTNYYGDFASTTRVNNISCAGGLIFPDNYGVGVTGLYTSNRIQTIFNMGAAYKLPNDGNSTASAYGLYWSHQNAGSLGGANNLASHGIIILENGTYKGSWGGGRLVTPSDIRGTQFYDYNNTGYYVDPASSSNLYAPITFQTNDSTLTFQDAGTNAFQMKMGAGDELYLGSNNNYQLQMTTSGNVNTQGDWRFGANFVKVGNSSTYNSDDGSWGSRFVVSSTVHARIDVAQDANAVRASWFTHTGHLYSTFGTVTGHHLRLISHNATRQYLYNGYSEESGSYRAPIFYDSNDTGFYLNPASQSRLGSLKLDGIISGTTSGCAEYGRNHAYHTPEIKGYGAEFMIGAQHTEININYRTCNNGASGHTPTTWKWRAGSASNWSDHYMGLIQSSSSMRAPEFIDSNNTAYYGDFASTSTSLSTAGKLVVQGSHGSARMHINYQHSASDSANSGALTSWVSEPGITYNGAGIGGNINVSGQYYGRQYNSGYGCYVRFDKSNGNVEHWVTTGNSGTAGGQGSRQWYNDNAGNSFSQLSSRAPVFYDSNNTSYYMDLHSTSSVNAITLAGTFIGQNAYFAQSVGIGFTSGNIGGRLNVKNSAAGQIAGKFQLGGSVNSSSTGVFVNTTASYASSGMFLHFQSNHISGDDNVLIAYLDGDIVNKNNSYTQYSDQRLKENIVDATSKLEEIKQIRVRNFNFIGEDLKQIGVVAQELEPIFPGLVKEREVPGHDDPIKTVKYSVMVPILIKAMQEQQTVIDDLKSRLETLENQ